MSIRVIIKPYPILSPEGYKALGTVCYPDATYLYYEIWLVDDLRWWAKPLVYFHELLHCLIHAYGNDNNKAQAWLDKWFYIKRQHRRIPKD
jgi:hypothetical protein